MADSKHPAEKQYFDHICRGVKHPTPLGTTVFVGLRSLDPLLQYKLLTGWGASFLARLGLSTVAAAPALHTGVALLDSLGLSKPQFILLAMSVGAALKHIYWLTCLCKEAFPPSLAVPIAALNTMVNSLNSLLLVCAATSTLSGPSFPGTTLPVPMVLGVVFYAIGITVETVSEIQRRDFKDQTGNANKPMTSGLWRWARHINYSGYALWRAGYCMAGSGWVGGALMGLWQASHFLTTSVPALDQYCSKRYGEQWVQFKRDVKWILIPGIY